MRFHLLDLFISVPLLSDTREGVRGVLIPGVLLYPPLSLTSFSYAGAVIYFKRGSPELLAAARVAVERSDTNGKETSPPLANLRDTTIPYIEVQNNDITQISFNLIKAHLCSERMYRTDLSIFSAVCSQVSDSK